MLTECFHCLYIIQSAAPLRPASPSSRSCGSLTLISHLPPPPSAGVKKGSSKQHNGWRSQKAGFIPRRPPHTPRPFGPSRSGTAEREAAQGLSGGEEGRDRPERREGCDDTPRPGLWPAPPSPRGRGPTGGQRVRTTATTVLSPTCSMGKQSFPQRLRQLPAVLTLQECTVLGKGPAREGGARAGFGLGF